MSATDVLWGSTLTSLSFDPTTHRLSLGAVVKTDGAFEEFIVQCEAVSELRFANRLPLPWSHAEITEVHAIFEEPSAEWKVEIVLWSDAGIDLTCRTLTVTATN